MDFSIVMMDNGTAGVSRSFKVWCEKVTRVFLGRPMVCLLIAIIAGGYIAFHGSDGHRVLEVFASASFLVFLSAVRHNRICELVSIFVSVIGFSISFLYFVQVRHALEKRTEVIPYSGEATVISNNSADEGYKNVVLKLISGECVIFLTEEQFDYGETLAVSGTLDPVHSKGNPGDLNIRQYYRNKGIVRSLNHALVTRKDGKVSPIAMGYRLGDRFSKACYRKWAESTDEKTAMILAAMIVGDDSYLSSDVKDSFRDSNLAHLLVVSGAHVGYFAGMVDAVGSVFLSDKKKKTAVMSICLLFFGFVSGWNGPAARSIFSYTMVSFMSDGNRSIDRLSVCAASAVVIFLLDPFSMFSSGMHLSFGATFSILCFRRRVEDLLKIYLDAFPIELRRSIACFLCAQIGMIPVMMTMGNSFSLTDVMVVLVAGFPAEVICCVGLIMTVIIMLIPFPLVGRVLFVPIRGIASALTGLAEIGAAKDVSRTSLRYLPPVFAICIISFLLGILIRCGLRRRVLLFTGSLSLIASLLFSRFPLEKRSQVLFLDVGQGDCALLLHNGYAILIDGGRKGCGQVIENVMEYLHIETIDLAFATHLDTDHIGGLMELYEDGKIDCFYTSFWSDSDEMKQLQTSYPSKPDHAGILSDGDRVVVDEDLKLEVIWPRHACDGGNEDSLVFLVDLYGSTLLFTGDISEREEHEILEVIPEDVDVLKVSHHGSKYSTSEELLKNKKIDAAVISVGYNLYGHPSPDVIARLLDAGVDLYRTDEEGCVAFSASRKGWEMEYYFV